MEASRLEEVTNLCAPSLSKQASDVLPSQESRHRQQHQKSKMTGAHSRQQQSEHMMGTPDTRSPMAAGDMIAHQHHTSPTTNDLPSSGDEEYSGTKGGGVPEDQEEPTPTTVSGTPHGIKDDDFSTPDVSKKSMLSSGFGSDSPRTKAPANVDLRRDLCSQNLFVFHLPSEWRESHLTQAFSKFGKILSVKVVKRPDMTSKGYGFVCFEDPESAEAAVGEMDGYAANGKRLKVSIKKTPEECLRMQVHKLMRMSEQDPPDYDRDKDCSLFVFHLPPHWEDHDLKQKFAPYGPVVAAKVSRKEDGTSRGYGFVTCADPRSAALAIMQLNGYEVGNKRLKVQPKQMPANNHPRPDCTVFVFHLPNDWTDTILKQYFSSCGKVMSATVQRDTRGRSRGFGFVTFEKPQSARDAVEELNGSSVGTKRLKVSLKRVSQPAGGAVMHHHSSSVQSLRSGQHSRRQHPAANHKQQQHATNYPSTNGPSPGSTGGPGWPGAGSGGMTTAPYHQLPQQHQLQQHQQAQFHQNMHAVGHPQQTPQQQAAPAFYVGIPGGLYGNSNQAAAGNPMVLTPPGDMTGHRSMPANDEPHPGLVPNSPQTGLLNYPAPVGAAAAAYQAGDWKNEGALTAKAVDLGDMGNNGPNVQAMGTNDFCVTTTPDFSHLVGRNPNLPPGALRAEAAHHPQLQQAVAALAYQQQQQRAAALWSQTAATIPYATTHPSLAAATSPPTMGGRSSYHSPPGPLHQETILGRGMRSTPAGTHHRI